jgi:lysophospholipase L1-like esterase
MFQRNQQVLFQWSVGMMVMTPIAAMIQGVVMLNDYRFNHRDAPRPIMPARGVVVVDNHLHFHNHNDTTSSSSSLDEEDPSQQQLLASSLPPLRILVVGDSLAAGVGMTKSGTPVLPESIARHLSQACGGRVVYWTCVGAPGTSASQIVREVNDLPRPNNNSNNNNTKTSTLTARPHPTKQQQQPQQLYPHQKGTTAKDDEEMIQVGPRINLERLVKEWQYKRQLFWERRQERLAQEQEREEQLAKQHQQRFNHNALKQWWAQVTSSPQITPQHVQQTTKEVAKEWWSWMSHRVKEDLNNIQQVVTADPPPGILGPDSSSTHHLDDNDENNDENQQQHQHGKMTRGKEEEQEEDDDEEEEPLFLLGPPVNTKSRFFLSRWTHEDQQQHQRRRLSVNPNAVAHYDIAIVLTGLNDIKEAFMPFMMSGNNASMMEDTAQIQGGLGVQLKSVVQALRYKMVRGKDESVHQAILPNKMKKEEEPSSSSSSSSSTDDTTTSPSQPSQEWDYSITVGSSCLPSLSYGPTETKHFPSNDNNDKDPPQTTSTTTTTTTTTQPLRRPLVVYPALPVARLELFQTAPLCYFLKPLFGYMEENKEHLSRQHPHLVLFVPQPSLENWKDWEAGRGPLWESLSRERILYQLVDVADHVLEKIQTLMQQHYHPTTNANENENTNATATATANAATTKQQEQDNQQQPPQDPRNGTVSAAPPSHDLLSHDEGEHWTMDQEKHQRRQTTTVTATSATATTSHLMASDQIHPNDTGYEIWGKHIAAAIVKEWQSHPPPLLPPLPKKEE